MLPLSLQPWLRKQQHVDSSSLNGDRPAAGLAASTRTDQQSAGDGALASDATTPTSLTRGKNGAATHLDTENLNQPRIFYSRRALIVGTQNVCGTQGKKELDGETCDLGKIEQLAIHMSSANQSTPRVELLQETWLLGDWICRLHGILVIHHGPNKKSSRRGSGGVAILLNRTAEQAWNLAGRPEPFRPGPVDPADPTCCVIGISLRFLAPHHKHKSETFFICNAYAPDSGAVKKARDHKKAGNADPTKPEQKSNDPPLDIFQLTLDQTAAGFDQARNNLGNDTQLILGGDFNASIGT